MTEEMEAAIRKVQQANMNAGAAAFNLHQAEKVVEACHTEVQRTDKLRREAEHELIQLARGKVE